MLNRPSAYVGSPRWCIWGDPWRCTFQASPAMRRAPAG
ncbi:hypothetical protein X805_21140 [Sphaerotilus natans subsp. natans DSM 6575]|uniref:Uncharacterized protein n=1 Tax=Sphaerotilus natans subsp. natans DSM 6575 TaxID=1286631 RepID=A0A059KLC9_9BURK|nr:hypothetical protein X805_21140 [Sphaerotilus natans subsp. natans DSM 6575]